MRQISWAEVRKRFYMASDPLPRDKWRATYPNVRVIADFAPRPPPANPCPDCQGEGWVSRPKYVRRGIAKVLTKCESCKGTGRHDAQESQEDEDAERYGRIETETQAEEQRETVSHAQGI